jgi:hypothetical protein
MKVKIEDKDRFNVWIKIINDENETYKNIRIPECTIGLQRYPTSRHYAYNQVLFYQEVLKWHRKGEIIEVPPVWQNLLCRIMERKGIFKEEREKMKKEKEQ